MKTVGLFGLFGSDGFSEKYSFRSCAGLTFASHTEVSGAGGAAEAGSVERGSGASAFAIIVAKGRVGSFSPAGPVSTLRVIKLACAPAGGALKTKSILPAGGIRT